MNATIFTYPPVILLDGIAAVMKQGLHAYGHADGRCMGTFRGGRWCLYKCLVCSFVLTSYKMYTRGYTRQL